MHCMEDHARNRSSAPPHRLISPSKSQIGIHKMNLNGGSKNNGRDAVRNSIITNSSSSLVSAITLDEEAFERNHPANNSSAKTTKNAAFDVKPLPPVRGASFVSVSDPPLTLHDHVKGRRHSAGEEHIAKSICRFDLVCKASATGPLEPKCSSPFLMGWRKNQTSSPEHSSTERMLSRSLPTSTAAGGFLSSTSSAAQKGQIQSMLPLSKPMRRDVSEATMSIANKTNIHSPGVVTNHLPASSHNASTWAFSSSQQNTPVNHPLLLSSKLKASLLPVTMPVRQASGCEKWQEEAENTTTTTTRDIQIRAVKRTKTPPAVMAAPSSRSDVVLQKSKSFLMHEMQAGHDGVEGEEMFSVESTTSTSSTSGSKSPSWMMSPPRCPRRNYDTNRLRRALRASLRRSPLKRSEETLEAEATSPNNTSSGHKRSLRRASCSGSSINQSNHTWDSNAMKRLRRHSSPWISSPKDPSSTITMDETMASPLSRRPSLMEQSDILSPTVHELPLEAPIKDAFLPSSSHSLRSQSHSNSSSCADDVSFPVTPKTLARSSLRRFTSSEHGSDVDLMVLPQRQDSDRNLLVGLTEDEDDSDDALSGVSVAPPAA